MAKMLKAVGLMSGTSLDGIDVASIVTDGVSVESFGPALTVPYDGSLREAIRDCLGASVWSPEIVEVERRLTDAHAEAVETWSAQGGGALATVDVVGFHGQTILHRPHEGRTWQLGDGQRLASVLGRPVVFDFRSADVAAGGQGAPLVPVFHAALAAGLAGPVAVVNIGGVANVTWVGGPNDLLAFDTGPGNAPLDDWVRRHGADAFDRNGAFSRRGIVDTTVFAYFTHSEFFLRKPPKSLDRNEFSYLVKQDGETEDGAATIVECIAWSIEQSNQWFKRPPRCWILTGGGARNLTLVERFRRRVSAEVLVADAIGWNGEALEAQAFAFLAVRHLRGLPLSFPTTTGVKQPTTGGRLAEPASVSP